MVSDNSQGSNAGQPAPQPGQPGYQPNQAARVAAINAFRARAHPRPTDRVLTESYLVQNDWDVERAYQFFLHDSHIRSNQAPPTQLLTALATSNAPAPHPNTNLFVDVAATNGTATETLDRMPLGTGTSEELRRVAVEQFRDAIIDDHQETLSVDEAVLLMFLADWDMGIALEQYKSRDVSLDRLHVHFDRLRSDETNALVGSTEDRARQERQDERLAMLVNITTRSDFGSVQNFLAGVKFNLIKAIIKWFKTGIPVTNKKRADKEKVRKDTKKKPIPFPDPNDVVAKPIDNKWGASLDFYRRVLAYSGPTTEIPLPPLREELGDREDRAFGYLVDPDRAPLHAGSYFVEEYFVVEEFHNGKYWHNRFMKEKTFKWPEFDKKDGSSSDSEKVDDKRVLFDFKNPKHVEALSSWRRQIFSRSTGLLKRRGTQVFQPVELGFLWNLLQEAYAEWLKTDPEDGATMPVSRNQLQQWTEALNEEFAGTTLGEDNAQLRHERNWRAVGTQLKRMPEFTEAFDLPRDERWIKAKNAKQGGQKAGKKILSGQEYFEKQTKDIAKGRKMLAGAKSYTKWDSAAARSKEMDTVVAGDSETTMQRKAHEKRSIQKLLKMISDQTAAATKRRADQAAAGDDSGKKDVLSGLKAFDADGGPDAGDSEDENAAITKRKRASDGQDSGANKRRKAAYDKTAADDTDEEEEELEEEDGTAGSDDD